MKILYITTVGSTMGFFGSLIKELIDGGNIVDIATNESVSKVPSYYSEWGCRIFPISTSRSPFSIGNIKAIEQIKKLAIDYDIVHCHTPLAGMATRFACKKLRKKTGLKVIYTAHGFHFYKGAPLKNWVIYYPIERLCSRWTDLLITINKEDFEFSKKKLKTKKIEKIEGVGIDTQKFSNAVADRNSIRDSLNIPRDSILLFSVGELNKNKNHQIVIKALGKIKNEKIHYMIAGVGDQKEYLTQLASDLNVNLHLLGFRTDIDKLYKVSDICVFPSIREGLGLAAIEGMASGLPLLCADNRGTREYAFDGAIKCNCCSVDDFYNGILKMCSSDTLSSYGDFNKNFSKKFDYRNVNKKMIEIYDSLYDKR